MKKLGILLGVIVLLFGGLYFATKPTKEVETFSEITGEELIQKMKEKQSFTIYVYSDTCSACQAFTPILDAYLQKSEQKINKVATTKEAEAKLVAQAFGDKFQGTPMLLSIENGQIVDYFIGKKTQEEVKTYAEKNQAVFHA